MEFVVPPIFLSSTFPDLQASVLGSRPLVVPAEFRPSSGECECLVAIYNEQGRLQGTCLLELDPSGEVKGGDLLLKAAFSGWELLPEPWSWDEANKKVGLHIKPPGQAGEKASDKGDKGDKGPQVSRGGAASAPRQVATRGVHGTSYHTAQGLRQRLQGTTLYATAAQLAYVHAPCMPVLLQSMEGVAAAAAGAPESASGLSKGGTYQQGSISTPDGAQGPKPGSSLPNEGSGPAPLAAQGQGQSVGGGQPRDEEASGREVKKPRIGDSRGPGMPNSLSPAALEVSYPTSTWAGTAWYCCSRPQGVKEAHAHGALAMAQCSDICVVCGPVCPIPPCSACSPSWSSKRKRRAQGKPR